MILIYWRDAEFNLVSLPLYLCCSKLIISEFVEEINFGHINDYIVEFHGEVFKAITSDREAYVSVNNMRHDILPRTLLKFKNCSNAKEYIEAIECFAYSVLIKKKYF